MKKQFAVIGLGLFGAKVARTLSQLGAEVIAIDKNFELIDAIKDDVLIAVQLDGTDREALESQNIKEVDAAIVAMGSDFEETLLTVVTLKQIGVQKVISRAGTSVRREILERVGCDRVVLPEEEVGLNVAKELVSGFFFDQIAVGDEYSIAQLVAPNDFIGKSIIELNLRGAYRLNIVTIKRKVPRPSFFGHELVEHIIAVPKPEDLILEGDILVLFGHDNDLSHLADMLQENG